MHDLEKSQARDIIFRGSFTAGVIGVVVVGALLAAMIVFAPKTVVGSEPAHMESFASK